MTLQEKIKFIEQEKRKKYLYISPEITQSGARLIGSDESLELYEKMDENTLKFAEKEITNLIIKANRNNGEAKDYLKFDLLFCGGFDDLPNDMDNNISIIMNNKEKIVAVYRYVKSTEQREFFLTFAQSQTIYNYGYLYLSLAKLLELFEKNNVNYKIDTTEEDFNSSMDISTNFVISYSPDKKMEDDYQVKKLIK